MSSNLEKRVNPGILGVRPYVPGKTIQEAAREVGERDFIKLASNENPLGISPRAAEAIHRAVEQSFRYPEKSCAELRQLLALRLDISPDCLVIGNGADGILYDLAMTLLAEGDEVIIPAVTFSFYEVVSRTMRARVVPSAMNGPEIDLEDILRRVTARTKMVFLCNPNNPTGTLVGEEALQELCRRLPPEVFLVHDEVYADFADPQLFPRTLPRIRRGEHNFFIVRSLSKLYGLAGVRVGYGIGTPELVALINRARPPFEVSVLAQVAAMAALEDEEFVRETLALTRREKQFLYRRLEQAGLGYVPSHTNFLLIDVGGRAAEAARRLIEAGVIVRAYPEEEALSRYLRLTIGTREQNQRVLDTLLQWAAGR